MVRHILPQAMSRRLFGDRNRFGLKPDYQDEDWKTWQKALWTFYNTTQQKGIGNRVCQWGYRIVGELNLTGKKVLEVGPGLISHLDYTKTRPALYLLADVNLEVLTQCSLLLKEKYGVRQVNTFEVSRNKTELPFANESVDIIFTFNQLEHILELDSYVAELARVLKPVGLLVGAVPCEGGIAWGLGRFLTTRRYVHKAFSMNYDKIICWEHPSFVDSIKQSLDLRFKSRLSSKKPFPFLPFDFNLSWSFIYEKRL